MGPLIKFIGAAVWICIVTLGAVFYSFQTSSAKLEDGALPPLLGGLDYVKTNIITVPVFNEANVEGYFLARLVYTADPSELKKLTVPAESLITDQVYSYLYANPQIDFANRAKFDLDAFRNGIRDSINARVEQKLIHEVIIDQIDFLTRDETRGKSIPRRDVGQPIAPKTSASAH
ncbi:hypothetical protein C7441_108101 [Pseudaminobacter salicylatoxidans]|uniref:Flagellar protein FliL n=1 Tax=Pseudaminobacter salicylatoxidans TaxID=93369 RepID=A0A316C1U9_PSESE|nr:hypothetical protein C7441_108101 [Pseudaminobacter salicylatoxidans]